MEERRLTYAEYERRVAQYGEFYNAAVLTQLREVHGQMLDRLEAAAQADPEDRLLITRSDLRREVRQYAIDLQTMFVNSFDLLTRSVFEGED